MNRIRKGRWGILAALLGAALLAGCAERSWIERQRFWPFRDKSPPYDLGRLTPAQQLVQLRAQREQAASGSADLQERIAQEWTPQLASEPDPMIRQEIVRTLGYCRTATAAAALREALRDEDAEVRETACWAWGKQGGPEATTLLAQSLRSDASLDVRMAAARALGETGDKNATTALGEALTDADPAMQMRAVESLRAISGEEFGDDVNRWHQYATGQPVDPPRSVSVAERLQQMF